MSKKTIEELIEENNYLKELLRQNGISFERKKIINESSLTDEEKIDLYLNYFKGRNDIFAFQYVSKEGKKGCMPCCNNRPNLTGYCPGKCSECNHKEYVGITPTLLRRHLLGKDIFGIYPLLNNDLCNFLVFDFDDKDFKESGLGFSKICNEYNLDNLLEISQSGSGCHVWIFFDKPIKASKARKMGSYLLFKARDTYKGIDFTSLDRMFPSQDYLPDNRSGYGNLIILPLNGEKAKENKTVFVDENFIPYPLKNQFSILHQTRKINEEEVDNVIDALSEYQDVFQTDTKNISKIKLNKNDFGYDFKITETNYICIPKSNLNVNSKKFIERISSLPNPEYYRLEVQRRNLYRVNRILCLYREDDNYYYLPRGCKDALIKTLNYNEIEFDISTKLNNGKKLDVSFLGQLNESQLDGYNKLISSDTGIFVAPPGYGKTVVAIYLISQLKRNTLIIVDSINLMNQWKERLSNFLLINYTYKNTKNMFGTYCGSKKKLTSYIDIASIDSLSSDEGIALLSTYGLVIVDEVHHIGAATYDKVIRNVSSKYLYGFTATPKRSDNNERVIYRLIGDIKYKYNGEYNKDLIKNLYPEFTNFSYSFDEREKTYSDLLTILLKDSERNNLILTSIKQAIKKKRNILVLTDRVEHVDLLYNGLANYKNIYRVTGIDSIKQKTNILSLLANCDESFVLLTTGKLLGEGFDNKKLNCLFLVSPFKWSGTLEQYVGRLHRPDANKAVVEVHDFIDLNVYMFENMYHKRLSGYKRLGYSISENIGVSYKQIYSLSDYRNELINDIKNAKKEVIFIVSKYDELITELLDLRNKIKIYTNLQIHHPNINELYSTKCIANIIIIDSNIVWYGGINPFYKNNYETTIMRLVNKSLAKNIIK